MGEISAELKTFKSTVGSSLSSMSSTCTTIQSKLQELSSINSSTQSEITSNYTGDGLSAALSKFDRFNTIYQKVSASIDSDLKSTISEAQALIDLITELEELNTEIDNLKSKLNSTPNDDDHKSTRSSLQSQINDKESEFNTKHEEAKSKLEALKSKDSSLSFVTEFAPGNSNIDPSKLQYGTFTQQSYTASNGLTIKYWVYVPDYGVDHVDNLPCMLYMHGGSTHQSISYDKACQYGLGSKIKNKEITPSGVVIVPCVEDFTDKGVVALKELTDHVVQEQNCDTNRVSVSGHSYGGITACKLVTKYPNYWSACVPISGVSTIGESFVDVPTWSFNGTSEGGSGNTSIGAGQSAVNKINSMGGKAKITKLQTGHAGTNKLTYERTYESPDGINENPIDWIMRQTRAA